VPLAELGPAPALHLLVQDRDRRDLHNRVDALAACMPNATIEAFETRRSLLARIAGLPPHKPGERWPLVLIDLFDQDRTAPGVHLLLTVQEHPELSDRVALVAFTRYGHRELDDLLRACGARAVLSPQELLSPTGGFVALLGDLDLLAKGSTAWIRIGDPPSDEEDLPLIDRMIELFPELDDHVRGSPEQWERVRWILLVCKLLEAGYSLKAVERQLDVGRTAIENLREQLEGNRNAFAAGVVKAGSTSVDLAAVPGGLTSFIGRSRAVWELAPPRDTLDGAERLRWLKGLVEDLYPLDPDEPAPKLPADREAWVPPEHLPWLRHFLKVYGSLRDGKHSDPKPDVDRAIDIVAGMFDVPRERARHGIVHAVLCLEDSESDGPVSAVP
jgi:hypothetical protein